MSDAYKQDPATLEACMTGYPDMTKNLKYKLEDHAGRHHTLSDDQFEEQYEVTAPKQNFRNDFDTEMLNVTPKTARN